jgi:hypothetical protein
MNGQEQRIYHQLLAICSKPLDGLPLWQQQNCVLLKKQLEKDAIQKQKDAQLQLQLLAMGSRLEALGYVMSTMDALQIRGTLLLSSVVGASSEYDKILQARAGQPVFGQILLSITLMALPEFKILGPTIKRLWPLKNFTQLSNKVGTATTFEQLISEVERMTQQQEARVEKFGDFLDKTFGHDVHATRLVLEPSSAADEETRKKLAAYNAKNQMFSSIINGIQTMLQKP